MDCYSSQVAENEVKILPVAISDVSLLPQIVEINTGVLLAASRSKKITPKNSLAASLAGLR
jgi:hypothetical protein